MNTALMWLLFWRGGLRISRPGRFFFTPPLRSSPPAATTRAPAGSVHRRMDAAAGRSSVCHRQEARNATNAP